MVRKNYKIVIGHSREAGSRETYRYKYSGTAISLKTYANKIMVEFSKNVKKDIDILEDPYFYDVLRKAYLVYALKYGKKMEIEDIKIGDDIVYSKNTNDSVPFIFAMLGGGIGLSDAMGEKKFIEKIISYTQTSASEDTRIPAVYSLLASSSSDYEAQKFSFLWTAMNAYYRNIVFNKKIKNSKSNKEKLLKGLKKEKDTMEDFLESELTCKIKLPTSTEQNSKKTVADYYKLSKILAALSQNQIEQLYKLSYDKMIGNKIEANDAIADIEDLGVTKLPIFCLLLLEFPYYLRCNYFHGNKAPLLFSTVSSIELRALKVVNCFLRKYLSENIPKMFVEDFVIPKMDS